MCRDPDLGGGCCWGLGRAAPPLDLRAGGRRGGGEGRDAGCGNGAGGRAERAGGRTGRARREEDGAVPAFFLHASSASISCVWGGGGGRGEYRVSSGGVLGQELLFGPKAYGLARRHTAPVLVSVENEISESRQCYPGSLHCQSARLLDILLTRRALAGSQLEARVCMDILAQVRAQMELVQG